VSGGSIQTFPVGGLVEENITFQAYFNKATTVIDGGIRVSFDLSQDQAQAMIELIRLQGKLLQIAVIPVPIGLKNG
jgi:hypothetical protein